MNDPGLPLPPQRSLSPRLHPGPDGARSDRHDRRVHGERGGSRGERRSRFRQPHGPRNRRRTDGRADGRGRHPIPVHEPRLVRGRILRRLPRPTGHAAHHGAARRHRHLDGRWLPQGLRRTRLRQRPRHRRYRAVRRSALQLEPGRLGADRHRRPARQRDAGRQPAAGAQARLRPEGREPPVHEDVLGDPRPRLDPGDAPPGLQGGDDCSRRPDLPGPGQPRPGGEGHQRRDPRPGLLHHPGRHPGPGRGHRGGGADADRGRGADHPRRRRDQQGRRAAGRARAGRTAAGPSGRRELAVPQLPAHASAVCRRLQQPRP